MIALISVVIFMGFGLFVLRQKENLIRAQVSQTVFAEYVLKTKKDYIKTAIDRRIKELQDDYSFHKNTTDSILFNSLAYQNSLKQEALNRIKEIYLKKGGYVWVNELLKNGPNDYFVKQMYNPTRPHIDGYQLSFNEQDTKGQYLHKMILVAVKENENSFISYWWKELDSDTVSEKISYVQLFKPYHWILGSGIHLDEIEHFKIQSQTEFDKRFSFYQKTTIFYALILFIVISLIAFLQKRKIQQLITYYIRKVEDKEVKLIDFNNQLETKVNHRTNDLLKTNIALEKAMIIAEESNKLKSSFLANMSHEVRTPMNSILGFSDLLTDIDNTPEQIKRYVGFIRKSGEQLLGTINDILDISSLESNQLILEKQEVKLYLMLQEMYTDCSKTYKNHDVKFQLSFPDSEKDTLCYTDPIRFKQLFYKLISNAFKFTSKGTITFGYSMERENKNNSLLFFVKDTGIGIAENKQHLIFKHFSQAGEIEYRQGNGIGLSICKGIIELMEGDIWFHSKEHVGSTFYFRIPRRLH